MSHNKNIEAPTAPEEVACKFDGFGMLRGTEYSASQPAGIGPLDTERPAKHLRLVSPTWMRRIKAIVLEFANIEDCAVVIRQSIIPSGGFAYFLPANCLPLSSAAKLRTGAAIRKV